MADCTPNFIPGAAGCVMPTVDESRARLFIGGVLFRSITAGPDTNNISIRAFWFVCNDGTTTCSPIDLNIRPYDANIDTFCDVVAVEIEIYKDGIQVERWRVAQTVDCGSPIVWNSGLPVLKSTLDTYSEYIIIPDADVQTPGIEPDTFWIYSDDAPDHLAEFAQTNLAGGFGIDNNPSQPTLDAIRTGPAFTLTNIGNSEIDSSNGIVSSLNQPKYWNGITWEPLDPINPPTGSPPCAG